MSYHIFSSKFFLSCLREILWGGRCDEYRGWGSWWRGRKVGVGRWWENHQITAVSCPDPSPELQTPASNHLSTPQLHSLRALQAHHTALKSHLHFLPCSLAPPITHPKPGHHPRFCLPSLLNHPHHNQHHFHECKLTGASYWAKCFVSIFSFDLYKTPMK